MNITKKSRPLRGGAKEKKKKRKKWKKDKNQRLTIA